MFYALYSLTLPPSASTFLDDQHISACILAFTVIFLPLCNEVGHHSVQITICFPYLISFQVALNLQGNFCFSK